MSLLGNKGGISTGSDFLRATMGYMSDKVGGGSGEKMNKMPVPEQLDGVRLEPFDPSEFFLHKNAIEGLEWDALNSEKGRVLKNERIPQLQKLFAQSLKTGEHLKLFLLKGDTGVDGFVAMKVNTGEKVGTLTHVWLDERHHQAGGLAEVLHSSEEYLRSVGCDRGIVNAPHAMSTLERVGSRSEPKNFWEFKSPEDEGPPVVLEKAA